MPSSFPISAQERRSPVWSACLQLCLKRRGGTGRRGAGTTRRRHHQRYQPKVFHLSNVSKKTITVVRKAIKVIRQTTLNRIKSVPKIFPTFIPEPCLLTSTEGVSPFPQQNHNLVKKKYN